MINWNAKEKATNAIFLDEATPGKGRYFRARFLETGLVKYSFGVCLLTKEMADKFVYGFVGCPIVIDHKEVTQDNKEEISQGNICNVWFESMDGWYWCDGIIDSQEAIDCINNGYSVSCQYEITEYADNISGELHNGNEYDKTILNGRPEHLAIVKNPRYENALIAVNAICTNQENKIDTTKDDTTKKQGETMDDLKEMFGVLKDAMSFGMKAANACKNEEDKKEEEKADNKAKNEDTDKRELIRKIAAIAGKEEDSEDVKTIIKLAEKLAYDKSEAGTADNEEDEEDKKEDAKNKCKNEDEEDKKEDKELKYEEFKKEVEEDAKNKAKNSMDVQVKKFLQGGERKNQKIYMTQKEGIELGKKLY